MKHLKALTLLSAVGSAVAGTAANLRLGEDVFTVYPLTSGGTVGLTLVIEGQSPSGDWHQLAAPAAYAAAGAQPVIAIANVGVCAIRARVSSWTAGTISATAIAGIQSS